MTLPLAVHVLLLSLTGAATNGGRRILDRARGDADQEAGLSTLEIAIIALGLFLIAGVAVLAITNATNTRLNQIQ